MSTLTQESVAQAGSAEAPHERPNVLARIEAYKRREIAEAKLRVPLAKLERRALQAAGARLRVGDPDPSRRRASGPDRRGEEGLAV